MDPDMLRWTLPDSPRSCPPCRLLRRVAGNKWSEDKLVPYRELLDRLRQQFPTLARLQDKPNDTSKVWRGLSRKRILSHHVANA